MLVILLFSNFLIEEGKYVLFVFELKKGEDSRVVLNQLYRYSQMHTSFGITMLALDHGQIGRAHV